MKHLVLFFTFTVGLCAVAESGTRNARLAFRSPQRTYATHPVRVARRVRRNPRNQYITSEIAAAPNAPGGLAPATRPSFRKRLLSDVSVQVAAGLNAGYASANPTSQGSTRNAMAFSLSFEKKLNDTFYLCPELSYAQRGVQTSIFSVAGFNVSGSVKQDYLEMPLLLKAKLILSSPRWKLFFVGGGSVGLLLTRQVEVLGLVDVDLSNRFGSVDFQVVLGTGIEYAVNPDLAIVGTLRHQIGVVDIDTTSAQFYSRGIQLLLGAQFRL